MHMADALISPAVGIAGWAGAAAVAAYAAAKLKKSATLEKTVPMMGVLGAFVFAAQMINFTIPGTGSSGHLGGGLLLSILLGPHAAFLALTSVLTVQALFFADGGLLALGCNILNIAAISCYLVYPLIFKPLAGQNNSGTRRWLTMVLAAVINGALGAFGVVLETTTSGISELPFGHFVALMIPIHLAIGVVEGLVTLTVTGFIGKARPELLDGSTQSAASAPGGFAGYRGVFFGLLLATALVGGVLSWVASSNPDGLEWAMGKVTGTAEIHGASDAGLHQSLGEVQKSTSFMPDYDFKKAEKPDNAEGHSVKEESTSVVQPGTTVAGIVGAGITMLAAGLIGWVLRRRSVSQGHTR